jgi:hypothetical protein
MQNEMEMGGKLFFDLFVAMCNHVDDLADARQVTHIPSSPSRLILHANCDVVLTCNSHPRGTPRTI